MTCKICAGRLSPISSMILGWLGHEALPLWLEGLCPRCVYQVATENIGDDDAPFKPAVETMLDKWMGRFLAEASRRVAAGQPIFRCEVWSGWHGSDGDSQCDRFAGAEQREGRNICYACRGRFDRKKTPVYFLDQNVPHPKPYLIWATSPADLVAQAENMARSLASSA